LQGKGSRRIQAALNGGQTYYNKDHKEKENYKQILDFYTQDPKRKQKNAIRSFSTGEEDQLDATAIDIVAGDFATWRRSDVKCRRRASKRPPIWHSDQEVGGSLATKAPRDGVATPAKNNSSAGSPPFGNSVSSSRNPASNNSKEIKTGILLPLASQAGQERDFSSDAFRVPTKTLIEEA
jgi:hypothetical protein